MKVYLVMDLPADYDIVREPYGVYTTKKLARQNCIGSKKRPRKSFHGWYHSSSIVIELELETE